MKDIHRNELLCPNEEITADRVLERLASAAEMLERAVERLTQGQGSFAMEAEASIERIVATIESRREADLEQRLASAEAELVTLRAKAAANEGGRGRKTLPAGMVNLLAKQGVVVESIEGGALDAALVSLSLEQRIAVKAELMRSGLLG